MTHQAPLSSDPAAVDPGRQVVQLIEALRLVERIAGGDPRREAFLEEAASLDSSYDRALPVVQRRFDALAGEAAGWTAAGVEALIAAGPIVPRAAATRLAMRIEEALVTLFRLVGAGSGKA